jgi:hypothetical protein
MGGAANAHARSEAGLAENGMVAKNMPHPPKKGSEKTASCGKRHPQAQAHESLQQGLPKSFRQSHCSGKQMPRQVERGGKGCGARGTSSTHTHTDAPSGRERPNHLARNPHHPCPRRPRSTGPQPAPHGSPRGPAPKKIHPLHWQEGWEPNGHAGPTHGGREQGGHTGAWRALACTR